MPIYLDNAATSFPKPEVVYRAADEFMRKVGVNAGRGAYRQALEADRIIYEARRSLAKLFNIKDASRLNINRVGLISMNIMDLNPQKAGHMLDEKYGIMVRTGLHCAPCAHRTVGTIDWGTVRIGLGYFSSEKEIDLFAEAVKDIIRNGGC